VNRHMKAVPNCGPMRIACYALQANPIEENRCIIFISETLDARGLNARVAVVRYCCMNRSTE